MSRRSYAASNVGGQRRSRPQLDAILRQEARSGHRVVEQSRPAFQQDGEDLGSSSTGHGTKCGSQGSGVDGELAWGPRSHLWPSSLARPSPPQAIKLVERAIQFSDTMAHTRRGISERTRLAYVEGDMRGVSAYAERAKMDKIPDITVEVVRAQVAIQQGV